ncbi:unnamed protein product [Anisakis simplex]|uniref:Uncharacterized protein n=1 Tax=Anisakis simplex TaxID=6269 RepID=A0A0M3JZI8_ANISI|nr:unnamed protein product [Anisakis simplex]
MKHIIISIRTNSRTYAMMHCIGELGTTTCNINGDNLCVKRSSALGCTLSGCSEASRDIARLEKIFAEFLRPLNEVASKLTEVERLLKTQCPRALDDYSECSKFLKEAKALEKSLEDQCSDLHNGRGNGAGYGNGGNGNGQGNGYGNGANGNGRGGGRNGNGRGYGNGNGNGYDNGNGNGYGNGNGNGYGYGNGHGGQFNGYIIVWLGLGNISDIGAPFDFKQNFSLSLSLHRMVVLSAHNVNLISRTQCEIDLTSVKHHNQSKLIYVES